MELTAFENLLNASLSQFSIINGEDLVLYHCFSLVPFFSLPYSFPCLQLVFVSLLHPPSPTAYTFFQQTAMLVLGFIPTSLSHLPTIKQWAKRIREYRSFYTSQSYCFQDNKPWQTQGCSTVRTELISNLESLGSFHSSPPLKKTNKTKKQNKKIFHLLDNLYSVESEYSMSSVYKGLDMTHESYGWQHCGRERKSDNQQKCDTDHTQVWSEA